MVRTGSLSIKHGKQQQQKQLTDSTMLYLNESIFNRHLRGEHFLYGQPRKILHDHPMQPPSQQIHISIRVSATVHVRRIDSQRNKLQVWRKQSFAPIIVPTLMSMCAGANDFPKLVGMAQRRRFNSSASGVDCHGSARTWAAAPLKHSVKTTHPRAS